MKKINVVQPKKEVDIIEQIVRKHFQKTNREGLGFLETNITACIADLQKLKK